MHLSISEIEKMLDRALQTQPSNLYREIMVDLYDNGKTPPAEVASEVSIRKLCQNWRRVNREDAISHDDHSQGSPSP